MDGKLSKSFGVLVCVFSEMDTCKVPTPPETLLEIFKEAEQECLMIEDYVLVAETLHEAERLNDDNNVKRVLGNALSTTQETRDIEEIKSAYIDLGFENFDEFLADIHS